MITRRILGIPLDVKKQLIIAIQTIPGIGRNRAKLLIKKSYINGKKLVSECNTLEMNRLITCIKNEIHWLYDKKLRELIQENVSEKKLIQCYEGIRHQLHLPLRGQRTHSNARTARTLYLRKK